MTALTAEQSHQLLEAIRRNRVYWPVLLAVAPVCAAEKSWLYDGAIRFDRGSLRVVESLEQTKAGLRFKAPKSEKARAITLPALPATSCAA